MSQISDLTVFDGAATPVSHTLKASAISRNGNVIRADWRESSASVPAYAQIAASLTLETLPSGTFKVEATVEVPVMESVSGQNAAGYTAAPAIAYVNRLKCTGFFHKRSTITDRRLARQILLNLMGNISTSVTPAVPGFMPEAFDQIVSPT